MPSSPGRRKRAKPAPSLVDFILDPKNRGLVAVVTVTTLCRCFITVPTSSVARAGFVSRLTDVDRIRHGLSSETMKDVVSVSHQAPLTLLFYDMILNLMPVNVFNVAVDAAGAFSLYKLCALNMRLEEGEAEVEEAMPASIRPPLDMRALESEGRWKLWVAVLYYSNPVSVAVGCSESTQPLTNLLVLCSVVSALRKNAPAAVCSLAVSTYLSWWPIGLLPSVLCCMAGESV